MHEETLSSGMRVWSAHPEGPGPFPTFIMLHERYGPVQHTFDQAQRIADEGFASFLPDFFHRQSDQREAIAAGQSRGDLTDEDSLTDFDELVGHIRGLAFADADRIVMAGFCQTGRTPLLLSAQGRHLSGAVVYHGGIYPRDFEPSERGQESVVSLIPRIASPVFGAFGELDHLVPLPNVWTFRHMLEENRKSYQIHLFPGAPHAWMNDTATDGRYKPETTAQSWQLMVDFSREVTSGAWKSDQLVCRFQSAIQPGQDFLPTD